MGASGTFWRAGEGEILELGEIALERRAGLSTFAQTREIGREFRRARCWPGQRIDHPIAFTPRRHQAAGAEVAKVLGDFYLGLAEHGLKMADAQRPLQQQIE